MSNNQPIRVTFVALGCPKNQVDSEKMLGLIAEAGLAIVGPDDGADVIVINTCGFIEDARQEAFDVIEEAIEDKNANLVRYILVTGCLAQYWGPRLAEKYPEIDTVVGLSYRNEIVSVIKQLVSQNAPTVQVEKFNDPVPNDQARLLLNDPTWAYLRISEGCFQGCTFCSIPKIRGPFRSKPFDAVITEAQEFIDNGALELNLIGQETTGFGRDWNEPQALARLIRELNKLDRLQWIRVLYAHPASMHPDIIDAMASCDKVVPYLDLPLQHINDRILHAMNRHVIRQQIESLIQTLRQRIPSLTLRTTFMVGFPGETQAEFDELIDFITDNPFDALGCFSFSSEENTKAAALPDHCPPDTKHQRLEKLMLTQQEIAFRRADALIDKPITCLTTDFLDDDTIEALGLDPRHRWMWARHSGQAAEIDAETIIRFTPRQKLQPGQLCSAQIIGRIEYDLLAKLLP